MIELSKNKMHGGWLKSFSHQSEATQCEMRFSIYLPPQAETEAKLPVLYWLSGLTCTDENFMIKAGAQKYAAEQGLILVAPDTSPRGEDVPDDKDAAWDFGLGAGFYLNATEEPWAKHYNMYDYIVSELPKIIEANFPVDEKRKSISGHSMGGHGALTIALKNRDQYKSVSAFSPISAPTQCAWGEKAFSNYLGTDKSTWNKYDATYLVEENKVVKLPLFIDQGKADGFLVDQLKPELLEAACAKVNHPINLRIHEDYDHSYFFIASFIGEHIAYHAEALKA